MDNLKRRSQRPGRLRPPWRWDWKRFAEHDDPTRFIDDVFYRPSVRPTAAWVITLLFGLVAWLTAEFASTAAARAALAYGDDPSGVIPESVGRLTIAIVAIAALTIGWEPILSRRLGLGRQRPVVRRPTSLLAWVYHLFWRWPTWAIWRVPSVVWSAIDWFLARPIAVAAGTQVIRILPQGLKRHSAWFRYAILLFWIAGPVLLALYLPEHMRPFEGFSLWILLPAFLAIFGVVRRWQWVESDREAFLIQRGGPAHKRVGFEEDLRDEALTATVGLFLLIPVVLQQVDLLYDAFDLSEAGMTNGETGTLWQWMGFFGAELAKSVPFVDWSEVFSVANGSPIRPAEGSALGAGLVFLTRALLDLFLLAAVIQALTIASRLRDQNAAFEARQLNILDPFAELSKLQPLGMRDFERPLLSDPRGHVADFPDYEAKRLSQIAAGDDLELARSVAGQGDDPEARLRNLSGVERSEDCRNAALALMARQHPTDERTRYLLGEAVRRPRLASDWRQTALRFLLDVDRDAARTAIRDILRTAFGDESLVRLAVTEAGRIGSGEDFDLVKAILGAQGQPLILRAQAYRSSVLLALRQNTPTNTIPLDDAIRTSDRPDVLLAAAYGRALSEIDPSWNRSGGLPEEVAEAFIESQVVAAFGPKAALWADHAARCALGFHNRISEIPAGEFLMGAPETETDSGTSERPQHRVQLAAFGLGTYTVTFEEYDLFCEATGQSSPRDRNWGRGKRPAINVSWEEANAYCAWLGSWTGERFRLPSEAEWEYACRAGTETPFSFGETITPDEANYDGNFTYGGGPKGTYHEKTMPVGSYPANRFGLYDMHGNVWEWCADRWHETYQGAPADGSVWDGGDASRRVLRGGSWYNDPRDLRSGLRYRDSPTDRDFNIGFRVARTL
ncbi:MAG: formylglycine-generating enzyme family protein [Pseudomonadota bacterium]